ncbi:VOC family protein [Pseudonocardia humida]|uniref:VOC family protein n=1 Tax=Pseudonocardia humida TaxID=2800819 RepID=A0ABT1A1Z0_9PSEU|nr:VOC family protein [Pseudonocardia humida]MCO1657025.1 VOC family protein [Pseudonocardia humida]
MGLTTTTHLNFRGTAREALEYYGEVFDGEVAVTTYGQVGMPAELPDAGKVVFGGVQAGNGFRVMAYDVPGQQAGAATDPTGSTRRENGVTITDRPFFVSVRGATLDETTRYWDRLAEGASIIEPLGASAWSAGFGMLTDRFGVTWVLDVEAPRAT